jgi:ArsR family transcriptional regulator, arsenate/arsenite/antimonite-responsive transcriptional repressor
MTRALTHVEAVRSARVFAALSDPIRLRLYTLIAASDDEVCACSFVAAIGRSQPTVSHHLKILRDSGLVTGTKRGTWVWYRANPDIATEVTQLLPARISA